MKKAQLVVNLGSPDSYSVSDVTRYLREFLMDKYVIDKPFLLRAFLVNCIIVPFRAKSSAEAYKSIWQKDGSPLILLSKQFYEKFKQLSDVPVALGMRYGSPSIESAIDALVEQNPDLDELSLLPLYPHYAMATTLTVVEKTKQILKKKYPHINLAFVESFYNHPAYIDVLAQSIKDKLTDADHLLFSYHGIPESHVIKTDVTGKHCLNAENCCVTESAAHQFCYRHQVTETTRLVAKALDLKPGFYSQAYQSRLGKDPWLTPFTDQTIKDLAKKGVKRLAVVCPAFVADCLETIEEIGQEAKEDFLEHGGESFQLIPCLNDNDNWVNVAQGLLARL